MSTGYYRQDADARDWGVVADNLTECADRLNRAAAEVDENGGGDLVVPPGAIRCEEPVDIKYDRVRLRGAGRNAWSDGGEIWTPGTMLVRHFDGDEPLVKIRSPYGAGNGKKRGAALTGIVLHANELGDTALVIDSVSQIEVSAYITGALAAAVVVKCGVTGEDLAEAADVQDSLLDLFVRAIATAQQNAHCVVLEGTETSNFSGNRDMKGLRLTCQHANGRALWAKSADLNDIYVRAKRIDGGTGEMIRAGGRTAAVPTGCENNRFVASGHGAIYAEGTTDPGVTAGVVNWINPNAGNGTPEPTHGPGSYWVKDDEAGAMEGMGLIGAVFADSKAAFLAQRGLRTLETARIYNGSCAHTILVDPAGNEWAVRLNEAGDLETLRIAGAGKLSLPHVGCIRMGGVDLETDAQGYVRTVTPLYFIDLDGASGSLLMEDDQNLLLEAA